MHNTMTTPETTTAATTSEKKEPSIVDQLHETWKKNGGKPPAAAVNKKLVAEYLAARKTKEKAKAEYEKCQAAESETVKAIILANGKGKMRINGEVCLPMTRSNTVFFRGEGKGEVRDIG